MNLINTGAFIQKARKQIGISQQELGNFLFVTNRAVSKWERGLSCPDIEILKKMAVLFHCSIADIINGEAMDSSYSSNLPLTIENQDEGSDDWYADVDVTFNMASTQSVSPLLFGDNLEHTRGCINGGLSAQLLRNRKFAGKPGRYGCAHEWYPIGKTVFAFGAPYTRHGEGYRMHRSHECSSQVLSNYTAQTGGFGQKDLFIRGGIAHECILTAKAFTETNVTVALKTYDGTILDSAVVAVGTDTYAPYTVMLTASQTLSDARLEITFDSVGTVWVGAVSLLPSDSFRGMRRDVIECMKSLGIKLLRWPGGNFAGEYHWKDGFLPREERAPFQSYLWLETQPHTNGYDFHEINTDDFVALCREIGAEPFITLNPTWNTAEESAEWVEYCNGDIRTPMGRLRAENGSEQPYNVQFWSLGNEAGYGHMEGANTADAYAKHVRAHAEKMLAISPDLILCSSGPYPNSVWAKDSAGALSDVASVVSLHHYTAFPEYVDPAKRKEEYENMLRRVQTENAAAILEMRRTLDNDNLKISFDEWNAWYAWYRCGSVTEGIFAASFLHMLYRHADPYGIMMACHFESVNEGSIRVYPDCAELSPTGRAISVMSHHAGGVLCAAQQDAVATLQDGVLHITLVNRTYDGNKTYRLHTDGTVLSAVQYTSDDVVQGSDFTESALRTESQDSMVTVSLGAHSIAYLTIALKKE